MRGLCAVRRFTVTWAHTEPTPRCGAAREHVNKLMGGVAYKRSKDSLGELLLSLAHTGLR